MIALAIILRLFHIFGGIIWLGYGLFLTSLIRPTEQTTATDGYRVFYIIFKYVPVKRIMPITSLITLISGVLLYIGLYLMPGGEINTSFLDTSSGLILTIGAVFGILAFGHGIAVSKATDTYANALMNNGDNPSKEQMAELENLHSKLTRQSTVSLILLILAVIGMSTFRYI